MKTAVLCCAIFAAAATRAAATGDLFVGVTGQVLRLHDANADGDFLDALEVTLYATGIGPANAGMVFVGDQLFVTADNPARITLVRDLNGDGDALDAGETIQYAVGGPAPNPRQFFDIAAGDFGALLVIDGVNEELLEFRDLNGDGDALDAGEIASVAAGLDAPRDVAIRPDGAILLTQNVAGVPVAILIDRNNDGDYKDFAEYLSYVENATPPADIVALSNIRCITARTTTGQLIEYLDWTGDDDALDAGESSVFAAGISSVDALALAADGSLYASGPTVAGNLFRVIDKNGDGDALDELEVELVATGINNIIDMAIQSDDVPCVVGDADANGVVEPADIAEFAAALVGLSSIEPCRHDVNADGAVDGSDVAAFVALLLQ